MKKLMMFVLSATLVLSLATWTDGEFSYSLSLSNGLSAVAWENLIAAML